MTLSQIVLLGFFPTLMAFAAASDLVSMTISNRVSMLLVAGFIGLALMLGLSLASIGSHLLAGTAVLAITFTLFSLGWIGGGDAKLMAATAVWVGWTHLLEYVVFSAMLGGPLTLLLLMARGYELPFFLQRQDWIMRLHDKKNGAPYGIALAAAGLIVYPELAVWQAAAAAIPL